MRTLPETYAPLSGWDELPIHQSVAPIRFVDSVDPRAFERYWFTAQPRDASFLLVTGMGFYPNLDVADAYALLVIDGHQVSVRAQRRLGLDRADLSVGPITAEPVHPFAEWRLTLGENDGDLRFDIRWRDTKRASFRKMDLSRRPGAPPDIHLLNQWGGYETFGTIEGWIESGGRRVELSPGTVSGSRDHHWGIRDGVGGLFMPGKRKTYSHVGQWVEFARWAIWGDRILYNIDHAGGGPAYAERIAHEIAFDPDTKHFVAAVVTNRLADGTIRKLRFRQAGPTTAYLRCVGYSGPDRRGTPHGNHHHGEDLGGGVFHDAYDVADPAVCREIAGFEDHLCHVECDGETTLGIFECCNPALYEMCAAGVPGYGFLEGVPDR